MIEIWAAVVGVALTTVVAYVAFSYRAVITYELLSIDSPSLAVADNTVQASDGLNRFRITSERLTLRNRGLRSIDGARLSVERTPSLLGFEIHSTKTIPKESLHVAASGDAQLIQIDHMPRAEEIVLEWSYRTIGRYAEWRSIKGAGAKFKVRRNSTVEIQRTFWRAGFQGAVIGLVIATVLNRIK